jgi:alpha-beta hydrolase superfamily lysophospholipase
MAETSTLSTYTATDGENIAVQDWPLAEGGRLRGVVLIVHGLGEHAGRYDHVAQRLNAWGFAVRGYDQYGHGESAGPRGGLSSELRLLDDLDDLLESTRARMDNRTPLILLGHSMGGLVAARYVSLMRRPIDALVLSSPLLDPGLSAAQKVLLQTLPRIAPDLRVGNGVNAQYLSHDAEVVRAYVADPLCHDRISGRLARFIAEHSQATVACAARWSMPTLLMYAGADKVVNPAGSRAFASAAPASVVTTHAFEDLYHEIFNEADPEPVFAVLQQWLDARFPR